MAAKSLEELLRINPGDRKTLAQLVVAYAQVSMLIILLIVYSSGATVSQ